MPTVSVRNAPKDSLKIYRSATNWICEYLLGKRLSDYVSIHIEFRNNLLERESVYGDCCCDDPFPPRLFDIRIDSSKNITRFQQFQTLTHELVHMKQYAKGELFDYQIYPSLVRWKRKKIDVDRVEYVNHPWEKEATKLQREITLKWARDTGYEKYIRSRK